MVLWIEPYDDKQSALLISFIYPITKILSLAHLPKDGSFIYQQRKDCFAFANE
jgi:hypothetical protein